MNLPLPCPPAMPAEELARLEREFAAYRRELPRLLATGQAGQFALFHNDQLVGVWDSQSEASQEGRRHYGLDPITVKRIDPRDVERLAILDARTEAECRS